MVSAGTFEMRKHLSTLPSAKPKRNAYVSFKSYELLIHGHTIVIINMAPKNFAEKKEALAHRIL